MGNAAKRTGEDKWHFRSDIKQADFVSAFARGLDVIRAFDRDTPSMTLSSAATKTGMSRAAVRRFLLTLNELGYVTAEGDRFELSPKVLELGYAYLSSWTFSQIATPYLREGVRLMGENVSFGVLDGAQVIYVGRAEARRLVHTIVISIGSRVPAVLSAMGRVLLSNLPHDKLSELLDGHPLLRNTPSSITDPKKLREVLADVERKGWCFVAEEFEQGVLSLAVPIHDNGDVIGAISVGAPTTRVTADDMINRFLPIMIDLGAKISCAIGMRI